MPKRTWLATAACVAAVSFLPAEERDAPVDVAEVYRSVCRLCHPVPDARFATDRAWLDEVRRTA